MIYEDGFEIGAEIAVDLDSSSNQMVLHTMAQAMEKFADHFADNLYDLLIILGDRYEMLSVATAAASREYQYCIFMVEKLPMEIMMNLSDMR